MVKIGPIVGGNSGAKFDLWRDNRPVKQLDVWYGRDSGVDFEKYTVLKGIEVKWANNQVAPTPDLSFSSPNPT
ncbi:hypothetical protein N7467_004450 [Penicillium canescens]|nr:hypothetical protein N7467_004450 [Penicillium canescens]